MDIDLDLDCPECGSTVKVTSAQVAAQRTVRCRRGHAIKLQDDGGGFRKVQRSLDDLDRTLKDFGKK